MEEIQRDLQILIVFYSRFGTVRALANEVAAGARQVDGVEVHLFEVEERPVEELRAGEPEHEMETRRAIVVNQFINADAIVVGSPAYMGSMAAVIKRLFEECATASAPPVTDRSRPWRHWVFRDKVAAAFTSSATPHGGNEMTIHSILTMFMHLGMLVVTPGQEEPLFDQGAAPYGATAVAGPRGDREPRDEEKAAARDLGRRVAEVTQWINLGRIEWERTRAARSRRHPPVQIEDSGASTG